MSIDVPAAPGALLTTEELARLVKVDPSTVRRWRTANPVQGPAFIRLSARVVKYDPEDVRAWLGRHRTDPEEAAR
nr:helix-turn-helix domain-containing protein [Micromonospora purpureochromogenes]